MNLQSFKSAWQKVLQHKVLLVLAIVILAGAGFWIYKSRAKGAVTVRYVTAPVEKTTVIASITGTGQVSASNQLDIKPQGSSTITSVKVNQGDTVKAGQVIATLDQKSTSSQLIQARASVAQAQASLDKLMAGETSSDQQLGQLSLDSAQKALDNAKKNYDTVSKQQDQDIANAYSTLLNSGLSVATNDTSSTATVTLSGSYSGTTQGQYTIVLHGISGGFYYVITGLGQDSGDLVRGLPLSLGNGLYVTFSTTGTISTDTIWTINVPNTQASGYLNNLNAYNAAVQNKPQALDQAQSQIDSAQNSLDQQKIQYNAKLVPPAAADIASAQAQIESAKAQLVAAETAYSNNIITAPFDGVIAKLDAHVGDQASSGTAIATLITHQKLAQISLNEVDVAKVKLAQKATLTFDAIDGLTITGEVAQIDALGTVSQGVVSYNVQIGFDTQDDRVKPGMSVTAAIITDSKQDVLAVPTAAIKTGNGGSYVQLLVNGQPEDHNVTTGISGDTDTEVSGDIKEGDQVITQTISSATAAKPAAGGASILQSLGGGAGGRAAGGAGFGGGAAGR